MNRTLRFLVPIGVLLALALCLALLPSPAWALGSSQYQLTDESGYIEGCFDPCMCPIFMTLNLQGSFQLTAVSQDGEVALFEVAAIDWQYIRGEETIPVIGSGQYTIDGDQHQLILELQVGGEPAQQFDSGLVPLEGDVEGLSIAVALNGFYCYDYVFVVEAVPAPVEETMSSWGSLKSIYR